MNPRATLTLVIIATAVFVLAGTVVVIYFSKDRPPPTPLESFPRDIKLSVTIGDHVAQGSHIHIVKGTTIVPNVSVIGSNSAKYQIELKCGDMSIRTGEPLTLDSPGFHKLTAEVSYGAEWPVEETITIEVTDRPRHNMHIEVKQYTSTADAQGIRAIDVVVRLSSPDFDVKNVYLNHLSLWLMDDSRNDLARLAVHSKEASGATEPDYDASFEDGVWTIKFSRPESEPPLDGIPTQMWLSGSGWEGDDYVDIVANPTPLPGVKKSNAP